jgi:acetoin utilization protein AcuC
MTIAILYRNELKEYDFGIGHPLRGDRFEIFPNFLRAHLRENGYYRFVVAEPATNEDLLKICSQEYIDFTKEFFRAANLGLAYDDRFYLYHSADNMPQKGCGKVEEASRIVIGQAKLSADLIISGQFEKAISIGGGTHHAKRSYGEGFCLYNDVAFTANYLLEKHGLERILILDTDAHAGNGTSDYFYANSKVLFIDIHQDPRTLYPGSGFAGDIGTGDGKGFTINIPLPEGAGNDSYMQVFEEIIEPITREFQPQIVIRNGGSDPHFADGLTDLGLTVAGFKMIGEKVRKMAETCRGKEIDLIASGYNAQVLPYAWLALLSGLADFPLQAEEPVPIPSQFQQDSFSIVTRKAIAELKSHLKQYWKCLR